MRHYFRISKMVVFVVITDDQKWSKKNLSFENVLFPGKLIYLVQKKCYRLRQKRFPKLPKISFSLSLSPKNKFF